jgi:peroxiredoxin Q/BCP
MLSWLWSKPLPAGTPAPEFSAQDDSGRTITLSSLRGRNVILVFYPGDDTPGCTKQLCDFRDRWEQLRSQGVEVFGVNPQSAAKHTKFRNKFNFPFPLIVDDGRRIAKLYNAHGPIIKRTVYLIGPDGVIRFSRRGMPAPSEVVSHAR